MRCSDNEVAVDHVLTEGRDQNLNHDSRTIDGFLEVLDHEAILPDDVDKSAQYDYNHCSASTASVHRDNIRNGICGSFDTEMEFETEN